MSQEQFIQEVISTNIIYALIDDDDNFAQIESEEMEQENGSPCMMQLLFSSETACKSLTNIQFTKYHPTPLPIEEVMEFLLAIDETGGLIMLNPTVDMNGQEYEPVEFYNNIGVALGLFE